MGIMPRMRVRAMCPAGAIGMAVRRAAGRGEVAGMPSLTMPRVKMTGAVTGQTAEDRE